MGDRENRAEILRRRIALYREYLKAGVAADLASYYLREIVAAEQELERTASEMGRPPSPN